ncbi:hypothetical protein AB1N83_004015 [Pleurotus pulmonarius]
MATSGNAWSQHFNPKATTPNPNIPPPQGGDSYSGNFSGGNNGGRGNHNAIFQADNESLDTMLDRIEAMMPNIDQERGYRALADLSNMKKKLDEMVKKRNTFEAQIKKQLGMA